MMMMIKNHFYLMLDVCAINDVRQRVMVFWYVALRS